MCSKPATVASGVRPSGDSFNMLGANPCSMENSPEGAFGLLSLLRTVAGVGTESELARAGVAAGVLEAADPQNNDSCSRGSATGRSSAH